MPTPRSPASMDDLPSCLNCGAPIEGAFCSACGQKASTARLTVRSLLADLAAQISSFDSSVLRTVRELTLRPGAFCRAYVEGQRVPYVSPLRYCATLVAITFLLNAVIGFRPTTIVPAGASQLQRDLTSAVASVAWSHADLAIFATLPLFALLVHVLFWRSRANYAETLVFVLYVVGHTFLLSLPLVPLKVLSPPSYFLLRVGVQLAIFSWAALAFYRPNRVSGLLRCLLAIVAYYLTVVFMVFLASLPELVALVRESRG